MADKFEQWAIVEVMGHQRFAGLVTEQSLGGANFVRVDIPKNDDVDAFTKLFGPSAIYCITLVTEDVARAAAQGLRNRPVHVYDIPQLRQQPLSLPSDIDEDERDEEEIPY